MKRVLECKNYFTGCFTNQNNIKLTFWKDENKCDNTSFHISLIPSSFLGTTCDFVHAPFKMNGIFLYSFLWKMWKKQKKFESTQRSRIFHFFANFHFFSHIFKVVHGVNSEMYLFLKISYISQWQITILFSKLLKKPNHEKLITYFPVCIRSALRHRI